MDVQFSTTFKMSDLILRYNHKLMNPVSDTVCVCRYVMCVYKALEVEYVRGNVDYLTITETKKNLRHVKKKKKKNYKA